MDEFPSEQKQNIIEELRRKELHWSKICQLIEEFHNAKQREKGISKSGRPDPINGKKGWGIRDTARELGLSIGRISEDLLLARRIRTDRSIAEIGDRKIALEKVRK